MRQTMCSSPQTSTSQPSCSCPQKSNRQTSCSCPQKRIRQPSCSCPQKSIRQTSCSCPQNVVGHDVIIDAKIIEWPAGFSLSFAAYATLCWIGSSASHSWSKDDALRWLRLE